MEPGQEWIFLLIVGVGSLVMLAGAAAMIALKSLGRWLRKKGINVAPGQDLGDDK